MNVGIDLGTTNSALAYIDPHEADARAFPPIHVLPIPQHVRADAVEPVRVLPSFLYLGEREYVGVHAREQGALVPTRLVHSAKSWLANPEVDRTEKILPWDSEEIGRVLSPVEVTAKLLAHLRDAWAAQRGTPLTEQDVVLTVPASFDEEARELTVKAAADVGLTKLTLLEEPAAAFYAWIANHLADARTGLFDGQVILVVDVGGGTSDFTLIRVARHGDHVDFTRTAVGKHLLLGGDNLDLSLAWLVEKKLGTALSLRQRNAVRRQCSAAKEALLSNPDVARVEIAIVGSGTALVGGVRKTELTRSEVLAQTLEGFLPPCGLDERPKEDRRTVFRELGLPYESDPAITRHLAAFMSGGAEHAPHGVDAILFNGGFFTPEILRERVADVVGGWYGRRPAVLENRDPDLAVAVGAAYYSFARASGTGVVVRGGLPRAYYIDVGSGGADRVRAVCLVPRGTEDGTTLELEGENVQLQLLANRPVSFRLYSSLTRTEDQLGAVIEFTRDEIEREVHVHAPLHAVMRFGKRKGERRVPVKLGARLTEIGTLQIWCASRITDHRWRLQFELRKRAAEPETPRAPTAVTSGEALESANALIGSVFGAPGPVSSANRDASPAASSRAGTPSGALPAIPPRASARPDEPAATSRRALAKPDELPSKLEQALGLGKMSWPLDVIRVLADVLLTLPDGRRLSPAHEVRWLNLTGFCLRPGFGDAGDEYRMDQIRRVWATGLAHPKHVENEVQWWVFWGRVAGGLKRHQQAELKQRLSETLLPGAGKRVRGNPTLLREMWRAAASLELAPIQTKTALGDAIARTIASGRFTESDVWCLMRLGARRLFHGPANQVVPPATATRWVETLLAVERAAEALVTIAQRTGDSSRDLPARAIDAVRGAISAHPDADRLIAVLEGEADLNTAARDRMFGERLPSGLMAVDSVAPAKARP